MVQNWIGNEEGGNILQAFDLQYWIHSTITDESFYRPTRVGDNHLGCPTNKYSASF